jgi:hypothetical protein
VDQGVDQEMDQVQEKQWLHYPVSSIGMFKLMASGQQQYKLIKIAVLPIEQLTMMV